VFWFSASVCVHRGDELDFEATPMTRDRATRNARVAPPREDQFELIRNVRFVRYLQLRAGRTNGIDVTRACGLVGAAFKPGDIPLAS